MSKPDQDLELEAAASKAAPARLAKAKLSPQMAEILARRQALVEGDRLDISSSGIVHVWNGTVKLFSFAQPNGLSVENREPVCREIMLQRFAEFLKPENFVIVAEAKVANGVNVVTKDGYKYTL